MGQHNRKTRKKGGMFRPSKLKAAIQTNRDYETRKLTRDLLVDKVDAAKIDASLDMKISTTSKDKPATYSLKEKVINRLKEKVDQPPKPPSKVIPFNPFNPPEPPKIPTEPKMLDTSFKGNRLAMHSPSAMNLSQKNRKIFEIYTQQPPPVPDKNVKRILNRGVEKGNYDDTPPIPPLISSPTPPQNSRKPSGIYMPPSPPQNTRQTRGIYTPTPPTPPQISLPTPLQNQIQPQNIVLDQRINDGRINDGRINDGLIYDPLIACIKSVLEEKIDPTINPDLYNTKFILEEQDITQIGNALNVNMKVDIKRGIDEVVDFKDRDTEIIEIEWKYLDNCSPLLIAAKFGLKDACIRILKLVKETSKQREMLMTADDWGNNALSLCARYGYQGLGKLLINRHKKLGIDLEGFNWEGTEYPDTRGDNFSKTPLMIAAEMGHMGIVELLLISGANPLAQNDIHQTSLHHCVKKCCPSFTHYQTPFGNIKTNTTKRFQYFKVHNDKYKDEPATWRFVRIIHLLMRFMIFNNGDIGNYREGGLKAVLQNDDNSKNPNQWDSNLLGHGAYTSFSVSKNSNWMSYFQLRKGRLSTKTASVVNVDEYRTPFIKKIIADKVYSAKTYTPNDYKIIDTVFSSEKDKQLCPLIANDHNMLIELNNGFVESIWQNSGSKDFIDYFLQNLYFISSIAKYTDNEKVVDTMAVGRNNYLKQNYKERYLLRYIPLKY